LPQFLYCIYGKVKNGFNGNELRHNVSMCRGKRTVTKRFIVYLQW